MKTIKDKLKQLYFEWYGDYPRSISAMPQSGSYRQYFRIINNGKSVIGVYNEDIEENRAFLSFTRTFLKYGLHVPEVFISTPDDKMYILQDLGDTTLIDYIRKNRDKSHFFMEISTIYKQVIDHLLTFQIEVKDYIDYEKCYPRQVFDKQSMLWDLYYFKYNFVKFLKIPFSEQRLEYDFQAFTDYVLSVNTNFFMFRDFQSSNIMLYNNGVYFLDYQGGRKGALFYDLASLLYDAKADLPQGLRDDLVDYYFNQMSQYIRMDRTTFQHFFQAYVLMRMMQAMGAYGFRGLYEGKGTFIKSIPLALRNLKMVLKKMDLPVHIPELTSIWNQLADNEIASYQDDSGVLTVRVTSFSYKKGMPVDYSGHGGGYIFDCRGLPNPGRLEEFKHQSGKDSEVIQFLEHSQDVQAFLQNVYQLSDQMVSSYQNKNFTNLMISFGCTGGQHRSVFAANKLAEHLKKKENIHVLIDHREQDYWK